MNMLTYVLTQKDAHNHQQVQTFVCRYVEIHSHSLIPQYTHTLTSSHNEHDTDMLTSMHMLTNSCIQMDTQNIYLTL